MDIQTGIWTHYSGSKFDVIGVATGSYLMGEVVVYRGVRSGNLYYRPVTDFLGNEDVDGYLVPRFVFTGELTSVNQS